MIPSMKIEIVVKKRQMRFFWSGFLEGLGDDLKGIANSKVKAVVYTVFTLNNVYLDWFYIFDIPPSCWYNTDCLSLVH